MKTLIVGCGYVGLPLAVREQTHGYEVGAWARSAHTREKLDVHRFHPVIIGSVAEERLWDELEAYDRVVLCASTGGGGSDLYREVFLEGARMMTRHQPAARKVFVSSTSVYGQINGEPVTEESPAKPSTGSGKILREAEEVALAAGGMVVRSSGIYGPGRSRLWDKFRRGQAVIEGDGTRWMNQIHRYDLISAISLVLDAGEPGQIYNATDDLPVMVRDYYAGCAQLAGRPLPPHGPISARRRRGRTSKRVSNARLRGLGWKPIYPTFHQGLVSFLTPPGHHEEDYSPR